MTAANATASKQLHSFGAFEGARGLKVPGSLKCWLGNGRGNCLLHDDAPSDVQFNDELDKSAGRRNGELVGL